MLSCSVFKFIQTTSGKSRQNPNCKCVTFFIGKQQKRTRTKREDIVSAAVFIMRTSTR